MRNTILEVEDDPKTLRDTAAFLGGSFDVLLAGPDNPVRHARRHWHDRPQLLLALVDLRMPDIDGVERGDDVGFELVAELAQRPGSIIVVHTAYADAVNRERAARIGPNVKVIAKTSDPEEMLRELEASAMEVTFDRVQREHAWALTAPEVYRAHPGEVVVVCHQKVWGHGRDCAEALADARDQQDCPRDNDLAFVPLPALPPE